MGLHPLLLSNMALENWIVLPLEFQWIFVEPVLERVQWCWVTVHHPIFWRWNPLNFDSLDHNSWKHICLKRAYSFYNMLFKNATSFSSMWCYLKCWNMDAMDDALGALGAVRVRPPGNCPLGTDSWPPRLSPKCLASSIPKGGPYFARPDLAVAKKMWSQKKWKHMEQIWKTMGKIWEKYGKNMETYGKHMGRWCSKSRNASMFFCRINVSEGQFSGSRQKKICHLSLNPKVQICAAQLEISYKSWLVPIGSASQSWIGILSGIGTFKGWY